MDNEGRAKIKNRTANLTSYLTPWARQRSDPTIAYIELEAQPTPKWSIPDTDILIITIKNIIFAWVNPVNQGTADQTNRLTVTDRIGHAITPNKFLFEGVE